MAKLNISKHMPTILLVSTLVVFVYLWKKNPAFKKIFTDLFATLKGSGAPAPTPAPAPAPTPPAAIQPAAPPSGDFTGRSTGPGTRSQDPVTQAINRCVGVGVNPPDPQAYNDCVNAAYPKANRSRIRIA